MHVQSHSSRHARAERCKLSSSGPCLCSNTECEQLLDGRRGGNPAERHERETGRRIFGGYYGA